MGDFPDYEAAAKTLTEFPFDDENDHVQDQARRKAFLAVKAALGEKTLVTECACGGWQGPFCDCSGLRWRWEYLQEWQDMSDHPSRNEEDTDE